MGKGRIELCCAVLTQKVAGVLRISTPSQVETSIAVMMYCVAQHVLRRHDGFACPSVFQVLHPCRGGHPPPRG